MSFKSYAGLAINGKEREREREKKKKK